MDITSFTLAIFSIPSETRWTRTTRYRIVILGTLYARVAGIVATVFDKNFTVFACKPSVAYAAVIVHAIKACS